MTPVRDLSIVHTRLGKAYEVVAGEGSEIAPKNDAGRLVYNVQNAPHSFRLAAAEEIAAAAAPASKFKVGDLVKSRENGWTTYRVEAVNGDKLDVRGVASTIYEVVAGKSDHLHHSCDADLFTLVSEPEPASEQGPPEGFRVGDLVEVVTQTPHPFAPPFSEIGARHIVTKTMDCGDVYVTGPENRSRNNRRFRLIPRPDADGWHTWSATGTRDNPPATPYDGEVEVKLAGGRIERAHSSCIDWFFGKFDSPGKVIAFRIVTSAADEAALDIAEAAGDEAIDTSKIKPGDFVTARLKVHGIDARGGFNIAFDDGSESGLALDSSEIVGHEPTASLLAVGDLVEDLVGDRGHIKVIEGDLAAVSFAPGDLAVVSLANLKKVA